MIQASIKETYSQISEDEYQAINPYVEAIGYLRTKKPNARVIKTKTVTEVVGGIQFPMLLTYYEVD